MRTHPETLMVCLAATLMTVFVTGSGAQAAEADPVVVVAPDASGDDTGDGNRQREQQTRQGEKELKMRSEGRDETPAATGEQARERRRTEEEERQSVQGGPEAGDGRRETVQERTETQDRSRVTEQAGEASEEMPGPLDPDKEPTDGYHGAGDKQPGEKVLQKGPPDGPAGGTGQGKGNDRDEGGRKGDGGDTGRGKGGRR